MSELVCYNEYVLTKPNGLLARTSRRALSRVSHAALTDRTSIGRQSHRIGRPVLRTRPCAAAHRGWSRGTAEDAAADEPDRTDPSPSPGGTANFHCDVEGVEGRRATGDGGGTCHAEVMAYIVMACIVMAYMVMAYIVAYVVMGGTGHAEGGNRHGLQSCRQRWRRLLVVG